MYKRKQGIHPVVLILILAVLCVAATVIILLAMGYRYVTNDDGYKFSDDGYSFSATLQVSAKWWAANR